MTDSMSMLSGSDVDGLISDDDIVMIARPNKKRPAQVVEDSEDEIEDSHGSSKDHDTFQKQVSKTHFDTKPLFTSSPLINNPFKRGVLHTSQTSTPKPSSVQRFSIDFNPEQLLREPRVLVNNTDTATPVRTNNEAISLTPARAPVATSITPVTSKTSEQGHLQNLSTRQLLVRVLENQKEILQRVKHVENQLKDKEGEPTSSVKDKITVPPGLRNAVRTGYSDGEKKGYRWHFAGKRVNDTENEEMTKHIITFVKGWNPNYSDPSVLNAAITRYFVTKKQDDSYKQKDRKEIEKKRRATYERKKEKSKRRKTALDKMPNISEAKRATINNVLIPGLMSSDEDCDDGFITHQPSWQSDKFRSYKEKLDKMYKEVCSKKSRNMLLNRTIGEQRRLEPPQLPPDQKWIVREDNPSD